MSDKLIFIDPENSGKTLYLVILNESGQIRDGVNTQFTSYDGNDWGNYDIALSEKTTNGNSGIYVATVPSDLPQGAYTADVRLQSGGSPAVSDSSIGEGEFSWDGSKILNTANTLGITDGLEFEDLRVLLAAFAWNLNSVTANSDGTRTVEFRKKDGTTKAVTVKYDPANGERTSSTVHSNNL